MNAMKTVQFDWDDSNLEHTTKHGVSRQEIEHVLSNDPMVQPDPHPAQIEERWRAIGSNAQGRMIFLVFTFRDTAETMTMRPISARYMHRKEVTKYEQQRQE